MATPRELFEEKLGPGLATNADRAKEIGATYLFVLEGDDGGVWVVDTSAAEVREADEDTDADVKIFMAASDFVDMVEGNLSGPQAFMMGKLRLEGDMSLALQLQELFDMAA